MIGLAEPEAQVKEKSFTEVMEEIRPVIFDLISKKVAFSVYSEPHLNRVRVCSMRNADTCKMLYPDFFDLGLDTTRRERIAEYIGEYKK